LEPTPVRSRSPTPSARRPTSQEYWVEAKPATGAAASLSITLTRVNGGTITYALDQVQTSLSHLSEAPPPLGAASAVTDFVRTVNNVSNGTQQMRYYCGSAIIALLVLLVVLPSGTSTADPISILPGSLYCGALGAPGNANHLLLHAVPAANADYLVVTGVVGNSGGWPGLAVSITDPDSNNWNTVVTLHPWEPNVWIGTGASGTGIVNHGGTDDITFQTNMPVNGQDWISACVFTVTGLKLTYPAVLDRNGSTNHPGSCTTCAAPALTVVNVPEMVLSSSAADSVSACPSVVQLQGPLFTALNTSGCDGIDGSSAAYLVTEYGGTFQTYLVQAAGGNGMPMITVGLFGEAAPTPTE